MNILQNYPSNLKPPLKAGQASFDNTQTEFKFVDNNSRTVGQATLWYKDMPEYKGEKIAFLGSYDANSEALGVEILHSIEEYAKSLGITFIIGPVDGNTWSNYRLVTKGFETPGFALENMTERTLPLHFLGAGFKSIASYRSTIVDTNPYFIHKYSNLEFELKNKGITTRPFSLENPISDLKIMYEISIKGFKNNFLYSPISEQEFIAKYQPIVPIIDNELVLIAEDKGQPIGFLFALPNKTLASNRDDTVVLKTLVRVPGTRYKGLGLHLVSRLHNNAYQKGYTKTIHALYKNDNKSSCFSKMKEAKVLREYDLYGKSISYSEKFSKQSLSSI